LRERIGIVGLGVMGSAMAGHLLAAGFELSGFDVDPARLTALEAAGGRATGSSRETAERSDIVMVSVASVAALDHVAAGVVEGSHRGLLVVEMGTFPLADKERARRLLEDAGVDMLDAPVSGTGIQAADATLVVLASGSTEGYERARALFDVIGSSSHHLGRFGTGSVMKYIANLLVAIHNLAAAEAHSLGIAAGLDPSLVQAVTSQGVGSSRVFDIRGPMMVADEYDPPSARLDIILKDAHIIHGFAQDVGAPTPLLDAAIPVYERSSEEGLGALDAAALCRHLERSAGLRRQPQGEG
jgi:L-threonate 2-dehydrogenase